jgi:HlyD family secretion protein
MRRIIIAIVILAVVIAASWFMYSVTAKEKEPPPPDYEVYTVASGDIAATVSSTGSVEPAAEANLAFRGAGVVDVVYPQVGDRVEAGDILARLETEELQLALDQAQINKKLAEIRLAQAQKEPESIDIAAAEAAVESARANAEAARASYQDLLNGPTTSQREAAEANEKRAKVMLDAAQRAYNEIAHMPQAAMLPQAVQLEQATIDYEVAKANVKNTLAPATSGQKTGALAQIAAAESAIVQAEAALERLKRGASSEDIDVLKAQVDQADIAVRQAQLALANTELVAPISGVISAINIRANEIPTPGLPAITLTDTSDFHVELNVDEIDIAQLTLGQPVVITVDALDDATLTGIVSKIDPVAGSGGFTPNNAIVTYRVTIAIDPTDASLRPGLTAAVSITTDEARDVVVLPNRVIRLDQQTGQPYVEVIEDGIPRRRDIVIGLRNEQFSEIVSGLEVGEQLAVRRTSTSDVLRQQMFGGG